MGEIPCHTYKMKGRGLFGPLPEWMSGRADVGTEGLCRGLFVLIHSFKGLIGRVLNGKVGILAPVAVVHQYYMLALEAVNF